VHKQVEGLIAPAAHPGNDVKAQVQAPLDKDHILVGLQDVQAQFPA